MTNKDKAFLKKYPHMFVGQPGWARYWRLGRQDAIERWGMKDYLKDLVYKENPFKALIKK